MGTDKRARQKANRAARMDEVQRVDRRSRFTRNAIRIGVIVLLVVGGFFLYSVISDDGGDDDATASSTEAGDTTTTGAGDTTSSSDGTATTGATSTTAGQAAVEPVCPADDGSSPRQTQFTAAPPVCIDPTATYTAVFDTSAGSFTATIDPSLDEASANNFVFLAGHHAYDGTIFHRIIDGFVVQGGDVQGLDGRGGPGYTFTGGSPQGGDPTYEIGALAMANTGDPSSNGSQFFVVTGPQGQSLPPNYSLFGQVTDGLDVVTQLQGVPTGEGDKPLEDIVVNSVTITEVPAS